MKHNYFIHHPHNTLKIIANTCGADPIITRKAPGEKLNPKTFRPMGMRMIRTSPLLNRDDIIVATPRNDPKSWFSHELIQVDVNPLCIILHYRNIFSGVIDRLILNATMLPPERSFFEFMLYSSITTESDGSTSAVRPVYISTHRSLRSNDLITEIKTVQTIAALSLHSSLQECKKSLVFSSNRPHALEITIDTD